MRPEFKEGVSPNMEKNRIFQERIKPHVKKALHWEGEDGLEHNVILATDPRTAGVVVIYAKVALRGYAKHLVKLYVPDALRLRDALREVLEIVEVR